MSSQADPQLGARSRMGFNGQPHEPGSRAQLLGNGYRTYSPTLMRFHSPDASSPFGNGGIHAYAFCGNQPVTRTDLSGEAFIVLSAMLIPTLVGGPAAFLATRIEDKTTQVALGLLAAGSFALSALVAGVVGKAIYKHASARFQERRMARRRPLPRHERVRRAVQRLRAARERRFQERQLPPSYESLRQHNFDPDGAPPSYEMAMQSRLASSQWADGASRRSSAMALPAHVRSSGAQATRSWPSAELRYEVSTIRGQQAPAAGSSIDRVNDSQVIAMR